jgi:hypothetical protein
MTDLHPLDHEGRALWHLELLGCFDPGDAVAPWEPPGAEPVDWYDDDEYDDELACKRCGGEGFAEVDDPLWDECDEFGWGPCNACHGTGERRHQWVF